MEDLSWYMLSGKLNFPWIYLYEEKVEQKVTAREIQQSIYGAIAGETRFKKSLVKFYGIALYFSL